MGCIGSTSTQVKPVVTRLNNDDTLMQEQSSEIQKIYPGQAGYQEIYKQVVETEDQSMPIQDQSTVCKNPKKPPRSPRQPVEEKEKTPMQQIKQPKLSLMKKENAQGKVSGKIVYMYNAEETVSENFGFVICNQRDELNFKDSWIMMLPDTDVTEEGLKLQLSLDKYGSVRMGNMNQSLHKRELLIDDIKQQKLILLHIRNPRIEKPIKFSYPCQLPLYLIMCQSSALKLQKKEQLNFISDLEENKFTDIYDLSNYITTNLQNQIFIQEALERIRIVGNCFKEMEVSRSYGPIMSLINEYDQLQRNHLREFERAALLVTLNVNLKQIPQMNDPEFKYFSRFQYILQTYDYYNPLYYDGGILVKQLKIPNYFQAKLEVDTLTQLRSQVNSKLSHNLTLAIPLCCSFDLYGQIYICYSFPQIDMAELSYAKIGGQKLIKSENALQAASAMVAVAKSKKVQKVLVGDMRQLYYYKDQSNSNIIQVSGFERIYYHYKHTNEDLSKVKTFEYQLTQQKISPLSSFELKLYAKHIHKISTCNYSDCTLFIQYEIIARALKKIIWDAIQKNTLMGQGLTSQKIIIQTFISMVNEVLFERNSEALKQLNTMIKKRFPTATQVISEAYLDNKHTRTHILQRVFEVFNVQVQADIDYLSLAKLELHHIKHIPIQRRLESQFLNPGFLELFTRLINHNEYQQTLTVLKDIKVDIILANDQNTEAYLIILQKAFDMFGVTKKDIQQFCWNTLTHLQDKDTFTQILLKISESQEAQFTQNISKCRIQWMLAFLADDGQEKNLKQTVDNLKLLLPFDHPFLLKAQSTQVFYFADQSNFKTATNLALDLLKQVANTKGDKSVMTQFIHKLIFNPVAQKFDPNLLKKSISELKSISQL